MDTDTPARKLRVAVYCDFAYRIESGAVRAQLPFSLFIDRLAGRCERLVVLGREAPAGDALPYRLTSVEFVPLPFYRSGADVSAVLSTLPQAARRVWQTLEGVDVLWVLGPNPPHALLFALLGRLRRRGVVLGVRQNLPELIRHRRPNQRLVRLSAWLLELTFRQMARRLPAIVVGPDLARRYRRGRSVLNIYVSLLTDTDLLPAAEDHRRYDGDVLVMLSVGRLDPEKNSLLLVDVLCRALRRDRRWRLEVCGDGPLADSLTERARELGVEDRLVRHGYVPINGGLWNLYRNAHALIHVSLAEGVPQVILEAFAARLPVVGTDVGGVGDLVAERGLLIAPSDPDAAADALSALVEDESLRRRLVDNAAAAAREHTLDAESGRVVDFLARAAVT